MAERGYEKYLTTPVPHVGQRGYERFLGTASTNPADYSASGVQQQTGLQFDTGQSRAGDIDMSGRIGARTKDMEQVLSRKPSTLDKIVSFGLQTAPYIVAAETGGALGAGAIRGLPVLGRILGSGLAQGGLAKLQGASNEEALKVGGLGAAGEGLLARYGARSALKRGVPPRVVGGTMERTTPGMLSDMFRGTSPEAEAAELNRVSQGTRMARRKESNVAQTRAEQIISAADAAAGGPSVSTDPIKQALLNHVDQNAMRGPRQALNNALIEEADNLPPTVTHAQLNSYIKEMREGVSSTFGAVEQRYPATIAKSIAEDVSRYRGQVLPGIDDELAQSSEYIDATKSLRKMLVGPGGKPKPGAVGVWRQALENDIVKQRLVDFDRVTDGKYNVVKRGMELARRKAWSEANTYEAIGILRLTSNVNPVVSVRTPSVVGKLALGGSRVGGAISASMLQDAYLRARTPRQKVEDVTNYP